MPELPDVEGFRRLLAGTAAGQRIAVVHVPAPDIVRNTTPQALGRALSGRRLGMPWRHGKWLFAPVQADPQRGPPDGSPRPGDGLVLLMHFGMDGSLAWHPAPAVGGPGGSAAARSRRGRHDRLVLCCDSGELRYHSVRKLGGVWLVRQGQAGQVTGPLGPDALSLRADALEQLLARRRGGVKAALMDQSRVAGLGNLTVDEILWRAHVHPAATAAGLGQAELRRLHAATAGVLAESVPVGRVPALPGWLTSARPDRRTACPRCGTALRRARVAGRGTVWCPRCQPQPQK